MPDRRVPSIPLVDADMEAERAREQERDARERRARAIAGLPLREHIERAIVVGEGLESTKALSAVQAWTSRAYVPPVLVLAGGTGCGKTVACAWALAHAERRTSWLSAVELGRIAPAQYGAEAERRERAMCVGLLVVDDIGSEPDAVRMCAALLELVDRRQHSARRHRTILTTNLSRQAFEQRYPDARLASRMAAEAGIVAWVASTESDMRRRTS